MTEATASIRAYIDILRPEIADMDLALPAATALLAVYYHSGGLPELLPLLLAVIGGYCAITSSYVFNDWCDVDIDRINLPHRPLPSTRMTRREALLYAIFLVLVAAAVAAYLNPESLAVLAVAVATITFYSAVAKRNTPLSFIPVGIAYGLVPVGVWLAFDPAGLLKPDVGTGLIPLPAIFLGIMMCVADWGFTLSGVSRDVRGDRERGAPTMPVVYGVPATARFVGLCWLIGVACSLAIWHVANLGFVYLLGAVGAGAWMLHQCHDFIQNPEPERGGRLFLQGSRYRGVMFGALILDVLLGVFTAYPVF